MSTGIIRSIQGAVIETSPRKRTVRAVWSTDELDHYKTVFDQHGIDTSVFARNGVILWEHGKAAIRGDLPIANALEWGVERYKSGNALIGSCRFWEDEFSEARFQDYASGRLKAWSVNLIPGEVSAPTLAERRVRPDLNGCELIYRSGTLAEVSAVPIPGNPSTLTLSVERSMGGLSPGSLPMDDVTAKAMMRGTQEHVERAIQEVRRRLAGMSPHELAVLRTWIEHRGR